VWTSCHWRFLPEQCGIQVIPSCNLSYFLLPSEVFCGLSHSLEADIGLTSWNRLWPSPFIEEYATSFRVMENRNMVITQNILVWWGFLMQHCMSNLMYEICVVAATLILIIQAVYVLYLPPNSAIDISIWNLVWTPSIGGLLVVVLSNFLSWKVPTWQSYNLVRWGKTSIIHLRLLKLYVILDVIQIWNFYWHF
jgi:hypothetical protein